MKSECTLIVDIDGTLIPVLVDFEELRARIRRLLGVDHPLRPLGESIESLDVSTELKKEAWSLIEKAEEESLSRLNPHELEENARAVVKAVEKGVAVVFITMRSSKTASRILEALGLHRVARSVVTRDVAASRVGQLRHVVNAGLARGRVVFLGDTPYDEQAARALSIEFLRVENYKMLRHAVEKALEICGLA